LLYNATIRLVATIATLFRISIDRVQGHRELAATECPGLLFNLDLFREQLINTKLTRIKLTR
jgi:N-acetyl-anhydromuramyl-L-alanine amidase AmpD